MVTKDASRVHVQAITLAPRGVSLHQGHLALASKLLEVLDLPLLHGMANPSTGMSEEPENSPRHTHDCDWPVT